MDISVKGNKIDTSDRSRFNRYRTGWDFNDTLKKRKYTYYSTSYVSLICDTCGRGGKATDVRKAVTEMYGADYVYWDKKKKQFVCPFCVEGYLVRTKLEGKDIG